MCGVSLVKKEKEKVLPMANEKIVEFKQNIKSKQSTEWPRTNFIVKKYLEELAIAFTAKTSNKFPFICRKYYVSKPLAKVFRNKSNYSTSKYLQTQKSREELIETPILYCLPKMYETQTGAGFIVLYKKKERSTKPRSDVISEIFKMIFNHVKSFHRKSVFYTYFKKFCVVENLFQIVANLIKINVEKSSFQVFLKKFYSII